MGSATLDHASRRYDAAESAYLTGIREGISPERLTEMAEAACSAAEHWMRTAYDRFFCLRDAEESPEAARQVEIEAEVAESVADLWRQLVNAHREGQVRRRTAAR